MPRPRPSMRGGRQARRRAPPAPPAGAGSRCCSRTPPGRSRPPRTRPPGARISRARIVDDAHHRSGAACGRGTLPHPQRLQRRHRAHQQGRGAVVRRRGADATSAVSTPAAASAMAAVSPAGPPPTTTTSASVSIWPIHVLGSYIAAPWRAMKPSRLCGFRSAAPMVYATAHGEASQPAVRASRLRRRGSGARWRGRGCSAIVLPRGAGRGRLALSRAHDRRRRGQLGDAASPDARAVACLFEALCRPTFGDAHAGIARGPATSRCLLMWAAMTFAMMLPTAGPMVADLCGHRRDRGGKQRARGLAARADRRLSSAVWLGFAALARRDCRCGLTRLALLDPAMATASGAVLRRDLHRRRRSTSSPPSSTPA